MTSRPSLLFLVTEDWYFASHRLPIARAARDAGWQVTVACRLSDHRDVLEAEGFRVIPLDWDRAKTNPFDLVRDIAKVAGLYRREKPDLVHHVALKPVLVGGAAARLVGIKRVVNAITGFGFVAGGEGQSQVRSKSRVLQALPHVTKRQGSVLLLQNSDDLSFALSQKLCEPSNTLVIRGSGVDTQHFQPLLEPASLSDASGKDPSGISIGYAGRLLHQKGVSDLIDAFQIARSKRPDLSLLIAGSPDPANPASLDQATLDTWHGQDGIDLLGHVDDVRGLWRRCDIACMPSRGGEGIPKALLEAGACGRPAIVTDVPGCREVVVDGVSGLMVPPRDPEALAEAILDLAANAEQRRQFAVAIRDLVEVQFAEPAIVSETLALYDRMMG